MTATADRGPRRWGRLLLVGWLAIMWLFLFGEVTLPNVVNGLLVGAALVWVLPPAAARDDPIHFHPLPTAALLVWFAKALVVSNFAVAREVLAPPKASTIAPAIVACRLRTRSGRLATIVANAITLTPGTLTVDARGRPATLYVHVLSFTDVASVREDVADLERRVVAAFGTAEERAAICGSAAPEEVGA